ncbi:hypothetical protein A3770_08p53270 [Chloropicon primus]|uniref:Uncharacterized protein n=1 Tax=Chloropicon primus TaxID=1764295 RepID=A0A5B8MQK5_9CHLO|nr:hypothetical protein A3770_08p53270 [Chloropicon primus]|eukprot:QDZ22809.1 hypothetical protein A3770_08p53270 [Chloropicon primus]
MLYAHRSQQVPLQTATCCGPHLATKGMNHLTSSQAYASRSGMHQYSLTCIAWKRCCMAHGNIYGHEHSDHGACLHKTSGLGNRHNKLMQSVCVRSQTTRCQTCHPDANLQCIWSIMQMTGVPHITHDTRHVTSWRTRISWISSKNIQDVPEI